VARSVIDAIKDGLWDYEPEEPGKQQQTPATNALPGSKEKLNILAERLRSGEPLWNPSDRMCYRDEEE